MMPETELQKSNRVVTMRQPDDFHVHLRQGNLLKAVLPHTVKSFARALVMPNTTPAVLTAKDLIQYRETIMSEAPGFIPLMTFKLTDMTTVEQVQELKEAGCVAAKLYPIGSTTNSEEGVSPYGYEVLEPVFLEMQKLGMVLCIHAELPSVTSMGREEAYLQTRALQLIRSYPDLKIVIEHLTTMYGVEFVREHHRDHPIAATITLHHMQLTIDDVIGGMINPHHFCKPICKSPEDQKSILEAALSGDPMFFFGSDSAPHPRYAKEDGFGAAGIFSAPVALEELVRVFDDEQELQALENFASVNGATFYGLALNTGTIRLEREKHETPTVVMFKRADGEKSSIVPYKAGKTLYWKVK